MGRFGDDLLRCSYGDQIVTGGTAQPLTPVFLRFATKIPGGLPAVEGRKAEGNGTAEGNNNL